VQSVPITTKFNHVHDEVYSIQHYVIKFVSDLRQVGGFLGYSGFLHDITEILLKVALNTINQTKPHFVESYVKKSLLGYRNMLYYKLLLILYF
jgi:hypothetical protein